jgi:CTP:phosphocholine cytidylyltransferase-like protein
MQPDSKEQCHYISPERTIARVIEISKNQYMLKRCTYYDPNRSLKSKTLQSQNSLSPKELGEYLDQTYILVSNELMIQP